jgi:hypothetical protein
MRHFTVWIVACVALASGGLPALAQPHATSTSPATDHLHELRKLVADLTAKPEDQLTVTERLQLSDAYLQLGQTTLAVKNAFLARQTDPQNEDSWIALIRAQIANRHEVVYAEENFQGALRAFPHSKRINHLREELFFGQLKFGQPVVAVNHLNAWLQFELQHEQREASECDATFNTAHRLIEVLVERRAPVVALNQLQQHLEKLKKQAPAQIAARFDPLLQQVGSAIDHLSPEGKSARLQSNR